MPSTCPDCGSSMEFASQPARLLTGSCSGCGHSFTMLEGVVEPGQTARGGGAGSPDRKRPMEGVVPSSGPLCTLCGARLEISASPGGLTGVCSGCSTSFQFLLLSGDEGADRGPFRRPGFRQNNREVAAGTRARPCRNCGGPLQFTTSPEGLVTGTCASCGNRFTLPPRQERGAGREGRARAQNRGYRPRGGSTSRWGRRNDWDAPPSRFRPRTPPSRRPDQRESDGEAKWSSKRRHRRDDE